MMPRNYDPADWYWIVAGDESRWYSSAAAAYVAPDQAFLDGGNRPTRIANEDELWDVLADAGVLVSSTVEDRHAARAIDRSDLGRAIETVIRALKAANPVMAVPTRAQIIQAWKASK